MKVGRFLSRWNENIPNLLVGSKSVKVMGEL